MLRFRVLSLLLCAAPLQAQAIFVDGFENRAFRSGLGTNLEAVEDFAVAYPFTDFFKQSRPWFAAAPNGCPLDDVTNDGPSCFDTLEGDQLALDSDGWVTALPPCDAAPPAFCFARTVINSSEADYPSGTYLVLYDGNGTLSYGGATKDFILSTPGRDIVTVGPRAFWFLTLETTDPAPNHVRNIRILPPGFDPQIAAVPRFHPDFVARLAPYRSLRFMDWMRTNGGGFGGAPNPQVEFSDRALTSQAHWTREAGVPLEIMLELVNQTDAEPWFTIPHQASEAYVTAFAQLVLAQLEAGRRLYVEHSNEVWNNFPQGADIEAAAEQRFPGGTESGFTKRMNQHGLRSAQICGIFRQVFGAQADRVECALGAQAANTFTAEEAADCPLAVAASLVQDRCLGSGDAIAIAPYFANYLDGPENEDEVQLWTLDDLFVELNQGGQLLDDNANGDSPFPPDADDVQTPCTTFPPQTNAPPCTVSALQEVVPWIVANRQSADARGMKLIAYEGGQHLVGILGVENNQAVTDLFVAANREARMGAAYTQYLQSWKDNGGELFVHFTLTFGFGRFGSWGALESLTQAPDPPKQQAIEDFMQANPCWWNGCEQ